MDEIGLTPVIGETEVVKTAKKSHIPKMRRSPRRRRKDDDNEDEVLFGEAASESEGHSLKSKIRALQANRHESN